MIIVEFLVSNYVKCKVSVVFYKSLDGVLLKFCFIIICYGIVVEEILIMLEYRRKNCK